MPLLLPTEEGPQARHRHTRPHRQAAHTLQPGPRFRQPPRALWETWAKTQACPQLQAPGGLGVLSTRRRAGSPTRHPSRPNSWLGPGPDEHEATLGSLAGVPGGWEAVRAASLGDPHGPCRVLASQGGRGRSGSGGSSRVSGGAWAFAAPAPKPGSPPSTLMHQSLQTLPSTGCTRKLGAHPQDAKASRWGGQRTSALWATASAPDQSEAGAGAPGTWGLQAAGRWPSAPRKAKQSKWGPHSRTPLVRPADLRLHCPAGCLPDPDP